MTKANLAVSRFKTQESASKIPGSCLTCGTAKGPFIDPGVWLPNHGQIYLCGNCIREMADNLGLIPEPEPVEMDRKIKEANDIVNDYLDRVAGFSDLLVAAHGALSSLANSASQQREAGINLDISELPDPFSESGPAGIPSDSSSDESDPDDGTD